MAVTSRDKGLLSAAFLLILATGGTFGYLAYKDMMNPTGGPIPQVQLASVPYEPIAPDASAVKMETWAAPTAQSRGREWIYDAFTPPEIFYNARSRQFTVKPPAGLVEEEVQEVFGLELVSVRAESFRLQLLGFVGEEGSWRGMFVNTASGETIIATAGHRIPKLNLTIKDFSVKPQPVGSPGSMQTPLRVATAVVRDETTGTDMVLSHRERALTGAVFAYLAEPEQTTTREVRAGDVVKLGEATYKIEKIEIAPPTVTILKESPNIPQPDRQVLKPREVEAPETPGDTPPPAPPPN